MFYIFYNISIPYFCGLYIIHLDRIFYNYRYPGTLVKYSNYLYYDKV